LKKIAIIPARGGSKRIPRKNIVDFHGKPLIAYSIEAAKKSGLFDEVMVSTDDKEISQVAIHYGASIPFFRSNKNADDFATTSEVIFEVLEDFEQKYNQIFDHFCCIYATSPFISSEKLIKSHAKFFTSHAASLIPVVKYSFPPQRAFVIEEGVLKYIKPNHINSRSQDLTPVYHDAGQFYWGKVQSFIETKLLVSEDAVPFIVPDIEVQDIDDYEDLELAKLKFIHAQKGY
jgi:pseudaminic acid cytidylyltransferase